MFLTTLAVALFILYKVTQYINAKYDRCSDFSRTAEFRHNFWRTCDAIEGFSFTASMVCVWFRVGHMEFAIVIADILLFIMAFSITCVIVMSIVKSIEFIFESWNGKLDDVRYYLENKKESFDRWQRCFKRNTADIVSSSLLNCASVVLYIVMIVSMASLVIPQLHR